MDNVSSNFSPKESANRALQAYFGICYLLCKKQEYMEFFKKFSIETVNAFSIIEKNSNEINIETYKALKDVSCGILSKSSFFLFNNKINRIWKMFFERFSFSPCQLRASKIDIAECFNLDQLAKTLKKSKDYISDLPISSELVIISDSNSTILELVMPPRLLIIDMILMLIHAREINKKLNEHFKEQLNMPIFRYEHDSRIDTYSRQILILATTICDNIISEYGLLFEAFARKHKLSYNFKKFYRLGVTAKLQEFRKKWPQLLNVKKSINLDLFKDMEFLIQIRNRIVHPDGRINCWHAFNISPETGYGWKFSSRIKPYISDSKRMIAKSQIGSEYSLSKFCVDTTIAIINNIHSIVFPNDNSAPWLELAIDEYGKLLLDETIEKEHNLKTV